MKKKLSDKQRSFVSEYCIDKNATQACVRAGYSKKTANQIGPRLLLEVANRIIALEKKNDLLYDGEKDDTLSFSTMVARSPEVEQIQEKIKIIRTEVYNIIESRVDFLSQLEKRITDLEGKLKNVD
jgi:phage terminase small subunit